MNQPSRRNPVAVALYVNAVLLMVLIGVLLGRDGSGPMLPGAFAQAPQPIAGGAGLFLMPAQFSANVWGCYIMDVDQQTLCAYTMSGNPPQLRLAAARNFQYDRKLGNYNTATPSPQEVKDLIEKEQQSNRVTERPSVPVPSPEK